jgi:nucleoside-diphosphate-sugar epimerase
MELASGAPLELVIVRPPLVYGPRVRANFLALMHAIARGLPLPLASIRNRRSLVYVGNLCGAVAACVESPAAAGKLFQVADGEPVSTPELCRAIGRALGRPARLFSFPPPLLPFGKLTGSLEVDDRELRRELGWRPPFSFEEGLRATAEWYRQRA